MKIFIGLTEIAGYYTNLKKGFDELGMESVLVHLSNHPFQYGGNKPNILTKLVMSIATKRESVLGSNLVFRICRAGFKICWTALLQIVKVLLFSWAILKYDVFIFGFQSTFLFFYDLAVLRLLGKRIIYVFHGSDSRPPYIDGAVNRNLDVEDIIELTRKRKRQIKRIEQYADAVISSPFSSQLHERPIICFQIIGIPFHCDMADCSNTKPLHKTGIRILHAPSDPEGKGTYKIREVIKNVQARGYQIEFKEIIGKPNAMVQSELADCDFVIDSLYCDTPMAGFATEAAFFGKPAIVCGYAQEEIYKSFPSDKIPPVYYCHPDKIEEAVQRLVVDKECVNELGRMAKHFVESNWTPKKVAERFLQIIEGSIPKDWLYDPKDISYLHGYGLHEMRVKELVREVIEKGGKEALQLSDKPELESRFVRFAHFEKV